MPNLEIARTIDGWMYEPELNWLAEQASRRGRIAEVGCWMGRSTRALADNTKGPVVAVDTWKGSDEDGHRLLLADKAEDWLFNKFMTNMDGTNVIACRLPSVVAAAQMTVANAQFDMVFLDAGHGYEDIKADILAWGPLVANGGILCGHDYHSGAPGVIQAVDELLQGVQLFQSIWYVEASAV